MVASGNILEREAEQDAKDKASGTRRMINAAMEKKRAERIAKAKAKR